MKLKKIIFFGSGDLGLEALIKLKSEFQVSLVITKDRPRLHKGPMPVYDYCLENNIDFITPSNKNEVQQQLFAKLKNLSDVKVGVVVDYGIIIPEEVINYFKFGIINSHFSLLPKWRGADPITFPILAGEKETGVTFMKIDRGMDTGELIKSFKLSILPDDNQQSLTDKLSALSDQHLCSIIKDVIEQKICTTKQNLANVTYSRMLHKDEKTVNFNKPASLIERESRAFSLWPKMKLSVSGIECIIRKSRAIESQDETKIGKVEIKNGEIKLYCGRGSCLIIEELQPLNKKTMKSEDFIRGYVAKS
jgi:methionyl-tRNA formyltransferase